MGALELLNREIAESPKYAPRVEPRCDSPTNRRDAYSLGRLGLALRWDPSNTQAQNVVRLLGASAPSALAVRNWQEMALPDFPVPGQTLDLSLCSLYLCLKLGLAPEKIPTERAQRGQRRTELFIDHAKVYCCTVERCEACSVVTSRAPSEVSSSIVFRPSSACSCLNGTASPAPPPPASSNPFARSRTHTP